MSRATIARVDEISPVGALSACRTLPSLRTGHAFATVVDAMDDDARDSPPPPGRRVLIVDGDRHLAEAAGAELRQAGFTVTYAPTLAAARAAAGRVDVAVIDPRLPDGDGLALVPALLAAHPMVKIVLTTGFAGAVRAELVQRLTAVLAAATEPRLATGTGKMRRMGRADAATLPVVLPRPLADVERDHIRAVYEQLGKSQQRTCEVLGISLSTLRRRLAEMSLL